MRRTERLRMTVVTALSSVWLFGWLAFPGVASWGQDPTASDSRSLLARMTWLRVDVVSGRLEPRGFRSANVRILQSRDLPNGESEELQLISESGCTSLRFEHRRPASRDTVFVDDKGKVLLRCESSDPARDSFEFDQTVRQPLRITVTRDGNRREYRSPSLWHFAFEQPELATGSLERLIGLVRPGWSLTREADAVREALQRSADHLLVPDRADVEFCVKQLASDRFAERKAADRRLRELGPGVLPIVDQLDPTTFDREQRERLRRITEAMGLAGPDSPQQVAQRLSADPRIWTALLNHSSAEQRRLATRQVERLTGRSIGFDPDAAPAIRAARRDELLNSPRRWK